jgi:phenylalanyl-tRNA synthetase beta chain
VKFTYNWLKQYVEFDWSPQQLAERLTFAGIEVERLTPTGGGALEQVVVGQVLSSQKHPNADHLSVCRVTDGTTERQIVCGATNYKVGDKVALALPGVTLPDATTIRTVKLRGVESEGMMCSGRELGISEDAAGLLILPADTPLGITLSEALGGPDTVFEVEVTPNRPDWLSVIGIAREVSALTGNPVRLPEVLPAESAQDPQRVRVDAPDLCPRYSARLIRGVKIAPSPLWLQHTLQKVGMRAVNNVVDVTNYVLLECGQPLHAFDFNRLAGRRILVRRAQSGERFVAIDGSEHQLSGEMLVIADAERAVALAGIMGGKDTEISEVTTDVLLESAWFLPTSIRRTSKRLGISSESSYRFERGADIGAVLWASERAALLIRQLAGGEPAPTVAEELARPVSKRRVSCRYAQVNRLLGIELAPATVKKIFNALGLTVVREEQQGCEVEVPTYRVDLEREADLIEELCRIHGVENIPARMQPATVAVSEFDAKWDAIAGLRAKLTALGFDEAVNQTMVREGAVRVQNPLGAEMAALRSSLVPGLLQNLRTNVSRHVYDVKLFEIGRVFGPDGGESLHLALAATGRRWPGDWERRQKVDYFDLKGALEELGLEAQIRQIPAEEARRLDLRDAVFVAEVALEPVLERAAAEKVFRELPRFPAVVRDVALVVEESVRHADVMAVIERHRNKFLERVELFDIFRGGSIPTGKKSMAYSLTYRAADRTLTDAEVNEAHEQLKRQLQAELNCTIRGD